MHLFSQRRSFQIFSLIWFGQMVSLVGSGLTTFGLGIWVYQHTGQVTTFALTLFFTALPVLLLSPLAGVLVDRWDYRSVMVACDTGAALSSLAVALLLAIGKLQVWHIYIAVAFNAGFSTFQQPAYTALTSQLVPKSQLGRAGGMLQSGSAVSDILSPLLAGALVVTIGLSGIILIDFATFIFAVITLLSVRISSCVSTAETRNPFRRGSGCLLTESARGWRFITARSGLVGLLIFSAIANFSSGVISALLVPMLLTFATANVVGTVISIAGGGMLAGSLILSLWGGPVKRIKGVLGFTFLKGLGILFIGLRPQVYLVIVAASVAHFALPISNALNQAIWQVSVPQELQGRVFALRQMLARSMVPVAFLLAGPLADRVFEPMMAHPHGILTALGSGPGRGMGLIFLLMGTVIMLVSVSGMFSARLQTVENE